MPGALCPGRGLVLGRCRRPDPCPVTHRPATVTSRGKSLGGGPCVWHHRRTLDSCVTGWCWCECWRSAPLGGQWRQPLLKPRTATARSAFTATPASTTRAAPGGGWVFYGTNSSLHSWAIADNDRSVANFGTTDRAARVFRLTNHRIAHYCLHNGFGVSDLGSWSRYASSNDWPWPSTCGVSPQSPLRLYPLGTQA